MALTPKEARDTLAPMDLDTDLGLYTDFPTTSNDWTNQFINSEALECLSGLGGLSGPDMKESSDLPSLPITYPPQLPQLPQMPAFPQMPTSVETGAPAPAQNFVPMDLDPPEADTSCGDTPFVGPFGSFSSVLRSIAGSSSSDWGSSSSSSFSSSSSNQGSLYSASVDSIFKASTDNTHLNTSLSDINRILVRKWLKYPSDLTKILKFIDECLYQPDITLYELQQWIHSKKLFLRVSSLLSDREIVENLLDSCSKDEKRDLSKDLSEEDLSVTKNLSQGAKYFILKYKEIKTKMEESKKSKKLFASSSASSSSAFSPYGESLGDQFLQMINSREVAETDLSFAPYSSFLPSSPTPSSSSSSSSSSRGTKRPAENRKDEAENTFGEPPPKKPRKE